MNLSAIPIILVICYMIGEVFKVVFKKKTKANKLIPMLVSFFGGLLGVVIYYTNKEILLNVTIIYDAMLVGIVSWASANQVIKQIFINKE